MTAMACVRHNSTGIWFSIPGPSFRRPPLSLEGCSLLLGGSLLMMRLLRATRRFCGPHQPVSLWESKGDGRRLPRLRNHGCRLLSVLSLVPQTFNMQLISNSSVHRLKSWAVKSCYQLGGPRAACVGSLKFSIRRLIRKSYRGHPKFLSERICECSRPGAMKRIRQSLEGADYSSDRSLAGLETAPLSY